MSEKALEITSIRINPSQHGSTRAYVSFELGGCFAIRGTQIKQGKNGLFASMPTHQDGVGQFWDYCYPTTKEFRNHLNDTLVEAYEQHMLQEQGKAESAALSGPQI